MSFLDNARGLLRFSQIRRYIFEIFRPLALVLNKNDNFQFALGVGSSVMMVTSLSLTADFIGGNIESSGENKFNSSLCSTFE